MELNHRVVMPGTGFEAALHTVALPSLTVVALVEPNESLELPPLVYETSALPVELIRH